jgi:hypothetical protein
MRAAAVMGVALFALASGCDKKDPAPAPEAHATASAPAPNASAPAATASASAAPAPASAKWIGTYTAKVGTVEPPKAAHEKTWTADPGTAAVGAGTIELEVSGPHGAAVGRAAGPLGDLVVSGTLEGGELRANLAPKDPNADGAMTGFLVGKLDGHAIKGTLRVSGRDAKIVREGDVQLSAK